MGRVRRWNREYAKSDFHDVYLAHVKRTHLRNVNFWFLRRRNMRKRDDRFCGIFSNRTCEILKEKSQRCAVDIFKSIWSINRMRFVSNFDNACMFAMCYFFKANSNYFRNATRFGYRIKLYESIRIGGFIDLGWRSSLMKNHLFYARKRATFFRISFISRRPISKTPISTTTRRSRLPSSGLNKKAVAFLFFK